MVTRTFPAIGPGGLPCPFGRRHWKNRRMLQVCLNGARSRIECAHLPVTAEELAAAALEAVRAGAEDIHLHPKDSSGADTMEPACVDAVVAAVRAAVPGIRVGVTTGAWTAHDAQERVAHV